MENVKLLIYKIKIILVLENDKENSNFKSNS